jgi:hypothetical protein
MARLCYLLRSWYEKKLGCSMSEFICKYGCLAKDEANCFVKCEDRQKCTLPEIGELYKSISLDKVPKKLGKKRGKHYVFNIPRR